jgi:SAM-dependent methyltransferase
MQHLLLEIVDEKNLDEARYLAANPDLRTTKRNCADFNAYEHFQSYGKSEGRKQLGASISAYMRTKYDRFRPILAADGYRFFTNQESFPLISPGAHFTLSDYIAESANPSAGFWIKELEDHPNGLYLDLGCGLRDVVFENCLYLEVYPSPAADLIVTPNTRLPLKDQSLDGLYCAAVLEHVEDPFFVAAEIKRVVKPGGRIFIVWPFLQPVHGYPSHYYNATVMGLQRMFEDAFEIEKIDAFQYEGADYTIDWILNWFVDGLEEGPAREQLVGMTVADLVARKPQDEFYQACLATLRPDMKMKLACGNTLIARRLTTTNEGSSVFANEVAALRREYNALKEKSTTSENTLNDLRNSITWKLVSPLWRLERRGQRKARRRTAASRGSDF